MKYIIEHPIRKSPGYYDCLNEVKDPKPTFSEIIKKERNDADMARQVAKSKEEELDDSWVMVIKDIPCNKGWEII